MTSTVSLPEITAIVIAARLQGPPEHRNDPDGRALRVLTLRGSHPGELYEFTLADGHRRWVLEAVTRENGIDMQVRTLGRRLSARLNVLHGIAVECFAQSPPPEPSPPPQHP
ncbi:hypothetical protein OK074_2086 [Actinobacteria bacterium OK074]|nr:hypothetical protein OK074_2086 [Actinobacteria bacterium OK074]